MNMRIIKKSYQIKGDDAYKLLIKKLRGKGYQVKQFPGMLVNGYSIFGGAENRHSLGEIEGWEITIETRSEEGASLDKFLSGLDL